MFVIEWGGEDFLGYSLSLYYYYFILLLAIWAFGVYGWRRNEVA